MTHDEVARPRSTQELVKFVFVSTCASEAREARESEIGRDPRRGGARAEPSAKAGDGQRLGPRAASAKDAKNRIGRIARQRPQFRRRAGEALGENAEKRVPNLRQGVNMVVPVDMIGRVAQRRLEAVELSLELGRQRADVQPPSQRCDDEATRVVGGRQGAGGEMSQIKMKPNRDPVSACGEFSGCLRPEGRRDHDGNRGQASRVDEIESGA